VSIKSNNIDISLGGRDILNNISVEISDGEITTVIGPNGAGKSTLLKALAGDVKPDKGNIFYDDKNLIDINIQERAFTRSVMSQLQPIAFDFSVREIIEMGWVDRGQSDYAEEFENAVMDIVLKCGVENLIHRNFNTLSGGEQRRIHFARTLLQLWRPSDAKDPKYLLLDEPTANLDLTYEVKMLNIIKEVSNEGSGVMLVLHDLNLAAKYSDKIILLSNGKIVEIGSPKDVLKAELLSLIYDIDIKIKEDPLFITYY